MTNSITKVFEERDGMSKAEAIQTKSDLVEEFMQQLIEEGANSAEGVLLSYGLEPDYIEDLIDDII